MAQPKREPAELARLSPSTEALVYGPGRVRLFELGRHASTWYVDEKEMRLLVETWLDSEARRRADRGLEPPISRELILRLAANLAGDAVVASPDETG